MRNLLALAATLALPLFGTACGDLSEDAKPADNFLLGDALPGTNAAVFAEARDAFNASENAADGLGPIFNERGCGTCHQNGAVGGAGQQVESRFGRLTNNVFDGMESVGGSLRQLFGIGGFNVGGLNCNSGTDANPAAGRDDLRGPGDHAAVRAGSGRFAARFALRHARVARARRHPRHRQPRLHRAAQPARRVAEHGRDARRPLRLEGRRAQPRAVLGRRLPERDGHHHDVVHPRLASTARSRPKTAPTARPPTRSSTAAPTTPSPASTTAWRPRPTTAPAA